MMDAEFLISIAIPAFGNKYCWSVQIRRAGYNSSVIRLWHRGTVLGYTVMNDGFLIL
tara:strand:+ start:6575 stop:6745 length:171 start_codon:yes stop_codon:yes gene_type:complete